MNRSEPETVSISEGISQPLSFLGVRQGRDFVSHQVHGLFQEQAGRLAGPGIANNPAAGRVRGILADAGNLQRPGIGDGAMHVETGKEKRLALRGFVHPVPVRQLSAQKNVGPLPENPGEGRVFFHPGMNLFG